MDITKEAHMRYKKVCAYCGGKVDRITREFFFGYRCWDCDARYMLPLSSPMFTKILPLTDDLKTNPKGLMVVDVEDYEC